MRTALLLPAESEKGAIPRQLLSVRRPDCPDRKLPPQNRPLRAPAAYRLIGEQTAAGKTAVAVRHLPPVADRTDNDVGIAGEEQRRRHTGFIGRDVDGDGRTQKIFFTVIHTYDLLTAK
jgi:hypothetical protein